MGIDLKRRLSVRTAGRICYRYLTDAFSVGSDEFATFIYCDDEKLDIKIGEKTIAAKERSAMLLDKGACAELLARGNSARAFVAEFEIKSAFKIEYGVLETVSDFGRDLLTFALKNAAELFGDLTEFVERLPRPGSSPVLTQSFRSAAELVIMRAFAPKTDAEKTYDELFSDKSAGAQTAKRIYEFLEANVDKKLTLQDVADEMFFSASYIKQTFARHAGKPVMAVFEELKMERAKELLRDGKSIEETAHRLAYADALYFSKVFKKVVGVTPSKFRKSIAT